MIALMRDVITSEPVGIHRTALHDTGARKREMPDGLGPKRMLGRARGAVVMLRPLATTLGIAEGIETALSAEEVHALPVWALLSAAGMASFPVIPSLHFLSIFADHDRPGLNAAAACATRYRAAAIDGEVRCPTAVGHDWNDHIRGANNDR